jgi:SAM-dependent methyltransferase
VNRSETHILSTFNRSSMRRLLINAARLLPLAIQLRLRMLLERRRDRRRAASVRSMLTTFNVESTMCALCMKDDTALHATYNGFRIQRCKHDGLMYVSPRLADPAQLYEAGYYTGATKYGYADYDRFAREDLVPRWNARLKGLRKHVGHEQRLFDVGCADGAFLNLARSEGWNVSGIELSAWAAKTAEEKFDLSVTCGSLPCAKLASDQFDIVTMWDVIEHVAHPRAVMLDVFRLLKPNGVVMLSTGAIPHRDPWMQSQWYCPPWHLYYWSKETISDLLQQCGFVIESYAIEEPAVPSLEIMLVTGRAAKGGPGKA